MPDDLCSCYLAAVRHYLGPDVAAASACHADGDGGYLVAVAPATKLEYYTKDQLERMTAVLSSRKPLKPANLPAMAVLAQKLERRKKDG